MKKREMRDKGWIIVGILICIGLVLIGDPTEFGEQLVIPTIVDDWYSYNSSTLLDDIDRNKEDIFIKIRGEYSLLPENRKAVTWSDSDLEKIFTAISTFTWKENITDWDIKSVSGQMLCEHVEDGLQTISIQYYDGNSNHFVRDTRAIVLRGDYNVMRVIEKKQRLFFKRV